MLCAKLDKITPVWVALDAIVPQKYLLIILDFAPVQAIGIPVADAFTDYLADVMSQMRTAGIRTELDSSDDRMQKKVRNAQKQKIPFMVIAGEEDQAAGAVSFRYRNGEQKNAIPIADAIAEIKKIVTERTQI